MTDIASLLKRPKLYYNIDGVGELSIGFMLLGFSLLGWLQWHAPRISIWHQWYTFVIYVSAMLAILHYGSKAIKNRITYPRTGFVEWRSRYKSWAMAGAAAVTTFAGLFLVVRANFNISTPGFLWGLVLAAGYIPIARTTRWKWAIFSVMVASVMAIAALPEDLLEAFAGTYWLTNMVFGSLLVISGGITFWLYLRHTQAPTQEGQ